MVGGRTMMGAHLLLVHMYGHGLNLGSWLAHAIAWSSVSTIMRHNQWLAILAVIVVVIVLIQRAWRRRRLGTSGRRS